MDKRTLRIGASEAPAALGLDEFTSPARYAAQKLGLVERDPDNDATRLGRVLEHGVAQDFCDRHSVRLRSWPSTKSTTTPWLSATPDRVIFPDDMSHDFRQRFDIERNEVVLLECKTTGLASYQPPRKLAQVWGAPLTDQVPGKYVVQTQVQGRVMGEELADLGFFVGRVFVSALLPSRGTVDYIVRVDPELGASIVGRLDHFVDEYLVKELSPPPETEDDWRMIGDLLRRDHRGEKTTIKATPGTKEHDALTRFAVHHRALELHGIGKEQARAELIQLIGNGYALEADEVGRVLLTSPREVSAPKLNKATLADDVVALADELRHLDPDNPMTARLAELLKKHTRQHTKGRVLMPYLK